MVAGARTSYDGGALFSVVVSEPCSSNYDECLDLPSPYKENDLRKALILKMRDFILELGRDFTFIDEEYKVQVGGEDYAIDLLFFHQGLQGSADLSPSVLLEGDDEDDDETDSE